MEIAKKHNLFVIEDVAQAIGADYKFTNGIQQKAGTIGTVGCTSFFPSKNLGCYGDGGALFTNDDALAAKIRMMANHGQGKQYYHDEIGCNSRLDSIQAAVLRAKLPHLDSYAAARNAAATYYDNAFANHQKIKTPARAPWSTHVFHQYTLQLNGVNRDGLREYLASKEIPAMIYYPVAVHQQKAYRSSRYPDGHFPLTEALTQCVISLPMHTELSQDQLAYITQHVLAYVNQ